MEFEFALLFDLLLELLFELLFDLLFEFALLFETPKGPARTPLPLPLLEFDFAELLFDDDALLLEELFVEVGSDTGPSAPPTLCKLVAACAMSGALSKEATTIAAREKFLKEFLPLVVTIRELPLRNQDPSLCVRLRSALPLSKEQNVTENVPALHFCKQNLRQVFIFSERMYGQISLFFSDFMRE